MWPWVTAALGGEGDDAGQDARSTSVQRVRPARPSRASIPRVRPCPRVFQRPLPAPPNPPFPAQRLEPARMHLSGSRVLQHVCGSAATSRCFFEYGFLSQIWFLTRVDIFILRMALPLWKRDSIQLTKGIAGLGDAKGSTGRSHKEWLGDKIPF